MSAPFYFLIFKEQIMAKFCGKCGRKLNENGLCPICDGDKITQATPKGQNLPKNKEKQNKSFIKKLIVILIILVIVLSGAAVALDYFKIADIPIINFSDSVTSRENSNGQGTNFNSAADIETEDADDYYANNATIISEMDINDSQSVLKESEVIEDFKSRGFEQTEIISNYDMEGNFYERDEVNSYSSSLHPIYQTEYVTESGELWTVFSINGVVMANPVSYNMQSTRGVQLIISETDTIVSYDSGTNKFYETIPKESALIVKKVNRINAETLEELTIGAIDGL